MAKVRKAETAVAAIEALAAMTKRGFDDVSLRFNGMNERFDGFDTSIADVRGGQKALENKFDAMWYELKDIKKQLEHVADRNELDALKGRVKHLEDRFAAAMRRR